MPGIFHQAGCCCGIPCNCCSGATPKRIRVTFSGVELATCVNTGGGTSWAVTSGTLDGTYTLTQDSGYPCLWASLTNSFGTRAYTSSSVCDDETSYYVGSDPFVISANLANMGGGKCKWFVNVLLDGTFTPPWDACPVGATLALFRGQSALLDGPVDCGAEYVLTSIYAAWGGSACLPILGKNGTVTINP